MANRREYRRKTYLEQVRARGVGVVDEPDHDDQVLLVPGVVNYDLDDADPGALERIQRAVPPEYELEQVFDDDDDDDDLGREPTEQSRPRRRVATRLEARRRDSPDVVDADATAQLVRAIVKADPALLQLVAPEYVFLTQQKPHPGEDPEVGRRPVAPPGRDHLGKGVRVLVIDTGLADGTDSGASCRAHPDDRDDLLGNGSMLGPAAGHGTFISSLIRLVAPGTIVTNVKVADPMGLCEERDIVRALEAAAGSDEPPHIINLSLGMHGLRVSDDPRITLPPVRLRRAILDVLDALGEDVAIVASAGNSDSTDPMYPAAFAEVVGVAALGCEGRRWPFSNFGRWVDASALGQHVRAEYVTGLEDPEFDPDGAAETFEGACEWSGTSFAAPIVAAQIAIVKAAGGLSAQHAQRIVLESSSPAPDPGCGRWVRATIPGHPWA